MAWVFLIFMCGCASGVDVSDNTPEGEPSDVLTWAQEPLYEDNTVLNVLEDIYRYDIYINDTGIFLEEDEPVASVSGTEIDNLTATLVAVASFDLRLLQPFGIYTDGVELKFVSVRSVGTDNSISQFGVPCVWE
jgi:hypothetical protein